MGSVHRSPRRLPSYVSSRTGRQPHLNLLILAFVSTTRQPNARPLSFGATIDSGLRAQLLADSATDVGDSFGGMDVGSFDLVGFYETRVRDLGRLSKQLGLSLPSDVYVNRTAPIDDRQLFLQDVATLSTLRSLLSDDVAFYEKARERWD